MKIFKSLAHIVLSLAILAGSSFASISNQTARIGPFIPSALPATLSVTFPYQNTSDLTVIDLGQGGTTRDPGDVLTLNSDYTVTGGGYNSTTQMQTGNVIVQTGGAHLVLAGDYIVILRNTPVTQVTTFSSTGILTGPMIEKALDKGITVSQQLTEEASRALRFEPGETLDGTLVRSARAGKVLGFDATGAIAYSTGGGGAGTTYTAGAGLLLNSNQFSVNPSLNLTNLNVSNQIIGTLTGGADTATRLLTPHNINGIPFDGTSDITVPAAAGTLTGASLAAGITAAPGLLSASVGMFGTMAIQNSGAVSISGGAITGASVTGLPAPSAGTDAATKTYVDNNSTGITQRTGVVAATTANITLSAPQTIDGQAVIAGNRVLVKNQTTTSQNGIYDVAAGAWVRSSDSNTAAQLKIGYYYFVTSGTTQGSTGWTIQTAPTVLNTDPVIFGQFSASTTYTAGTGLGLTGNVFSINSTQNFTGGSINAMTVGASTPAAVSSSSGALNGSLGGTTPAAAAVTTFSTTGLATLNGTGEIERLVSTGNFTAGGSAYINFRDAAANIGHVGFAGLPNALDIYGGFSGGIIRILPETSEVARFNSSGETVVGTITNTVANAVVATRAQSATGRVRVTGYYDATYGGIIDSVNTAESVQLPITIEATPINMNVGGLFIGQFNASGLTLTGSYTHNSNANLRATKGNFNLVVNVKDYGATGNGTTDDTGAISGAILALVNHGTLYFPPGKYRMGSGATTFNSLSYITITGEGAEIYMDNANANTFVFSYTCSDFEVCNLRFTSSATVRASGIHLRSYCSNVKIHDCSFSNSSDFAVHISNDNPTPTYTTNVEVCHNIFTNTCGDGVHVGCANSVNIEGNIFYQTGDDSIGIIRDSLSGAGSLTPSRINIIGNTINRAGYGPSAVSGCGMRIEEANDVLVSGNLVDFTYQAPIRVGRYTSTTAYNSRIKISGNKVLNGNQLAGEIGSINVSFCNGITVSENNIDSASTGGGIGVLDCNDLVIDSNQLNNIPNRGIYFDDGTTTNVAAASTRSVITNNKFLLTTANQAIYVVAPTGKTLNDVFIAGNLADSVPAGDWIFYNRISVGRIYNNVHSGSQTIGAGGTVSGITSGNNF